MGGTYYGLIELDQQIGLQARLGGPKTIMNAGGTGSFTGQPVTPAPVVPAPGNTPQPTPDTGGSPGKPITNPTNPPGGNTGQRPPDPGLTSGGQRTPPPSYRTPDPGQGTQQPIPGQRIKSPISGQPDVGQPGQGQPGTGQSPVVDPTPPPPTTVRQDPPRGNPAIEGRLQRVTDEAIEVASFFKQRQLELQQMKQPLRADIRSKWSSMSSYIESARNALRNGDAAGASRYLDMAEDCIDYLNQSK